MEQMRNYSFYGKVIHCNFAKALDKSRVQSNQKPLIRKNNCLFVGGLNFKTTKEKLAEIFQQYGEILDLSLPLN
jgi:RNA recognition motif-containing protein